MIDILALLMMLMSMASAIGVIPLNSSAVIIVPSVIVLQSPSASVNAKHCDSRGPSVARRDDYTYTPGIGGHKLHLKKVSWNAARLTCEKEGAHLAIINSIAESQAIAKLLPKSPVVNYAHIGFHDLFKEGQHVTIHGQSLPKVGFTEWASGEPNNNKGDENCGSVYKTGQLNDIHCDANATFICEIPMPSA